MAASRRMFLRGMAIFAGGVVTVRPAPIPRSYYSAERGHQGKAYLNGVEVPWAISCRTGSRGWVKSWKVDARGQPELAGDHPIDKRQVGVVTFDPAPRHQLRNVLARAKV